MVAEKSGGNMGSPNHRLFLPEALIYDTILVINIFDSFQNAMLLGDRTQKDLLR
jgi:hypothetical protein